MPSRNFSATRRAPSPGAAASGKEGYFEIANNGTLFLDEIGSLPLAMQSKLLRVLQENSFYRVGGKTPKNVNVRVICANNIPLQKLVSEGKFREDLYYRLNICCINVPPLRERPEDIACLAAAFIDHYSLKYGMQKTFTPEAYQKLEEYHWPGNVRELENTVHRLYISERERQIGEDAVDELLNVNVYNESMIDLKREVRREESLDFNKIMDEQEKKLIAYALKKEGTTRQGSGVFEYPADHARAQETQASALKRGQMPSPPCTRETRFVCWHIARGFLRQRL